MTVHHEHRVKRDRNQQDATNLMFLSNNYLNIFRASLCPPSGEQECALPHMLFCTGCAGCGCVELGRELPSVDVMFLTNLYALISSAEWSDFLTDSEGLSMSFISRSLLFLCNLSFMCADCAVCVTLYNRTVQSVSLCITELCSLCHFV